MVPNCSHAHALFQDRFKDVQVGSRWFSTLYILSPNFHTLALSGPCFTLLLLNLILCPRLCVPWVSLISALIGQMALWVRIACPFSAPPSDWRLIVAVHPRPLGCPLFCCFGGSSLCVFGVVSFCLVVCLCWLVSLLWPLCFSPFALGLSVVLLVVCVAVSPLPPRLFPGGVLAQSSFCCIGPSLWVSGCFLRRPGCLICRLECCGALLPRFMFLHGSKGLWPCVGTGLPSTPWACVAVGFALLH